MPKIKIAIMNCRNGPTASPHGSGGCPRPSGAFDARPNAPTSNANAPIGGADGSAGPCNEWPATVCHSAAAPTWLVLPPGLLTFIGV